MDLSQAVGIAQRLYDSRDKLVFLRGEQGFVQDVEKWKPVFDRVTAEKNCNELQALTTLLEGAQREADPGMLMLILCAVCCELTEPKYTAAS